MVSIMTQEVTKTDLKGLVQKFITLGEQGEKIGEAIIKDTATIFPLENVYIRKVKVIKRPTFDLSKLMEIHTETV